MKKSYTRLMSMLVMAMAGFAFFAGSVQAQVTITQWNFDAEVSTPSTGSGTAALIGGTTATFATGYVGGVAGGKAWNSSTYPEQGTGSATAGVEFAVSTVTYSNIAVSWDGRHSNTSANRIRLQYTLNGTVWTNFEASAANATNLAATVDKGFDNGRYIADAGDTWYQRSANFAAIAGASDNAAFGVRMVTEFFDGAEYAAATSTSTYGTGGTLRYDNVTFLGAGESSILTASPTSLGGFTYTEGAGPSVTQTLTLNGLNLSPATGTITLDAPDGFEFSVDGGTSFVENHQFIYENGGFADVALLVRLKAALTAGSYAGVLSVTGGGAPDLTVNLNGSVTLSTPAAISSIILPRFIEGAAPANTTRVPYAFRASFSNLLPSSTYRYYNKIVLGSDAIDYNGAGNCIFVDPATGVFTRASSTSMTTPGQYGEFTTDAAGSFSGWFMTEPTGNAARFKPGTELFVRIMLNDGAGGTLEATRLTSSESVKVLGFYTVSADSTGTAIRGVSNYTAKNFVFLYDNTAGTGRPLYGTQVEGSGVDFLAAGSYATFYTDNVSGVSGTWGGIVPNSNASGVQRLEERSLTTGAIVGNNTATNGVWGTTDTKNPTGGTATVLVINSTLGIDNPVAEIGKIYTYGNTLKLELDMQVNGTVQVIGFNGQKVAEYSINGNSAAFQTNLPTGLYIVRVIGDNVTTSSKVFIR